MIITVPKKTITDPELGTMIVPDIDADHWQLVDETETTMTIEILD